MENSKNKSILTNNKLKNQTFQNSRNSTKSNHSNHFNFYAQGKSIKKNELIE